MGRYFAYFERGAPCGSARFRFEPVELDHGDLVHPDYAGYRELGWEHLDVWEKSYHIFRADDPAASELHTDPKTQALTLDRLIRRHAIGLAAALGIWAFFCLVLFVSEVETFYDWVRVSFFYFDFPFVLFPLMIFLDRGGLFDLLALRKSLRQGTPQSHATVRRLGIPAGIITLVLTLVPMVINIGRPLLDLPNYRTVTDPAGLPYVALETIEGDREFQRLTDARPRWGQDYFNSCTTLRSLLMPEHIETRQFGEYPNDEWIQFRITRVTLLTEGLAAATYDSFAQMPDQRELHTIDLPGTDEACFARTTYTELTLREGRQVLRVFYSGDADLTAYLNEFTRLLH